MTQPFIASLDTMKLSKDQAGASMTQAQIAHDVGVLASLKPTHISVNTPTNQTARAILWLDAIHSFGLRAIVRSHTPEWESGSGQAPADYLTGLRTFLDAIAPHVLSGDRFDPCTEAENGWTERVGKGWTSNTGQVQAYNQFLHDAALLVASRLPGAILQHSENSFMCETPSVYYPQTVNLFGNVVCGDLYPDSSLTDPKACVDAMQKQFDRIRKARPGVSIMLGEWGWSIHLTNTDAQQQAVVQAITEWLMAQADFVGLNYWPALGEPSHPAGDQTASLCHGTPGNMALRPAAQPVAELFARKATQERVATAAVWNAWKIVRGNDTPPPQPDDAFVADLRHGATLGAVVNAIFASGEGQTALGKPI